MWNPFFSVPPVGTMTTVRPAAIDSRISADVRSSMNRPDGDVARGSGVGRTRGPVTDDAAADLSAGALAKVEAAATAGPDAPGPRGPGFPGSARADLTCATAASTLAFKCARPC